MKARRSDMFLRLNWRMGAGILLCVLFCALGGCGVNTPGEMDWVQPHTKAKRVGTVYMIRGWMGVFSSGIDKMAGEINDAGGTAYVFQDMQWKELGAELVKKYKGVKDPEPICFIGHSRGVDAALIIARDLEKI